MRRKSTLAERFWPKVERTDGCWYWRGAILTSPLPGEGGYGLINRGGRRSGNVLAHRASWELHYGPIPKGLWVLHRCDVRHCVRPDHLFLGDHDANMADMIAKGRSVAPPLRPAPLGERNWSAKVTATQVREIRDRYSSGSATLATLGAEFGIAFQSVSDIVRRKTWRHLTDEAGDVPR